MNLNKPVFIRRQCHVSKRSAMYISSPIHSLAAFKKYSSKFLCSWLRKSSFNQLARQHLPRGTNVTGRK